MRENRLFITKIIKIVLATAVVSALLTYGILMIAGFHRPGKIVASKQGKTRLWTCGMHPQVISKEPGTCPICGMNLVPKKDDFQDKAGSKPQKANKRKILYWRAPMNPSEIYDKPGKSSMGMDLVPVYEDEVGGSEIRIDPVVQQNMEVRTAKVKKGPLIHTIRTYGHITYDETRTGEVSPKVSGWLEKLYVNFTGDMVKKGQPLYEIYAPDLVAAQEEYLSAFRNFKSMGGRNITLLESARRRLKYFDVAETEIKEIEASGNVKKTILIRSPFTGVVTRKNAVEGAYIKAGTTVYKIADLSRVWVEAHIYEYELIRIKKGQKAQMTLPYLPGRVFNGRLSYVYPYLQQKTRDVVVRIEFENPGLELKPEMYADVKIETTGKGEGLIIPSEAVIRSGERDIVFVAKGDGKFSPRNTSLGMALDNGNVQILSGLARGELVVTSGQFLLDSESKLKEAVQKMMEPKNIEPDSNNSKAPKKEEDDFFDDMDSSDNTKGRKS